jgi:hypothetical protein
MCVAQGLNPASRDGHVVRPYVHFDSPGMTVM